jgi:alkylation response protein AidB-like acyl-CoA dehydrogenase
VDFELDEQQRTVRDEARRFIEAETGIGATRALMDDPLGHDPKVWRAMAGLGWTALPFPEEHGGLDLGFIALAILLGEMGRVVMPGPYLATMIAGLAIAEAGSDEQRARLLPAIAAGDATATLAHVGHVEHRHGGLHGTRRFVLDGATAQTVVVVAHLDDDEPGLFVAEPTARAPVATLDQTRRLADLSFDGAEGELLERTGRTVLHRIYDRAAVMLAAEMLGGAERVLELSVDYAGQREQFGRPIGSFQAVKHRAADMAGNVESLRNAVYYAAWAIERDHPDAPLAAATAKATASDAYKRVAQSGIQVHGGTGFTWEHDMHLFTKRALLDERLFGDASFHRERIAGLIAARIAASTGGTA